MFSGFRATALAIVSGFALISPARANCVQSKPGNSIQLRS
jgi:hypothetical protein